MSLIAQMLDELAVTPMVETCVACDGAGEVQSAAWAEFLARFTAHDITSVDAIASRMDVAHPSASALTRAGVAPDLAAALTNLYGQPDVERCACCAGTGTVLTPAGRLVADLADKLHAAQAARQARSGD